MGIDSIGERCVVGDEKSKTRWPFPHLEKERKRNGKQLLLIAVMAAAAVSEHHAIRKLSSNFPPLGSLPRKAGWLAGAISG